MRTQFKKAQDLAQDQEKKYPSGSSRTTYTRTPHDRENPYTMISRDLLQDHTLSFHALGLLVYLLSLPPNWRISPQTIATERKKNVETIRKWVAELIDRGYCRRYQERSDDGTLSETVYEFSEYPQIGERVSKKREAAHNECEPDTEKPCTVKPCTVNSAPTKYIDKKRNILETTHSRTLESGVSPVSTSSSTSLSFSPPGRLSPILKNQKRSRTTPEAENSPPKIVRAPQVATSEADHEYLLKKYADQGDEFVQECYAELAEWKTTADPKKVAACKCDKARITRWVASELRRKRVAAAELDQREARLKMATPTAAGYARRNSRLRTPQDDKIDDYNPNKSFEEMEEIIRGARK